MPVAVDFSVFIQFVFFSILFTLCLLLFSRILRSKSKNKDLNSTYECGIEPTGDAKIKFQPNFYIFALIFLVFEAECVLMFPFACAIKALNLYYIIEIMIFVLILIFSLMYGIKSGLLKMD